MIFLNDKDIELLKKPFPISPCVRCSEEMFACCGCPERSKYDKEIRSYEDRDIFNIAILLQDLRELNRKKDSIKKEYDEVYNQLKNMVGDQIENIKE